MTPQRAAGLVALVGFVAISAWSAGLIPSACCSSTCERCPTTFCKGVAADSCPKVDLSPGALATILALRPISEGPQPILSTAGIPMCLPPEFRRPMRN